jgi:large subunit ribosomal protein L23
MQAFSVTTLRAALPAASNLRSTAVASRRTLASLTDFDPSKTSTLPKAVRERRAKFPTTNTIQGQFTPAQEIRFQTLRAEGKLTGDELEARQTFLDEHELWRSRVRGHRQVQRLPEGQTGIDQSTEHLSSPGRLQQFSDPHSQPSAEHLVAQRIYLPNIQIRLMRNHTPDGQRYDPYVATFRIPPSMTKTDLRSYLLAVYGLHVTFIRTDNYIAPVARVGSGFQMKHVKGSQKNYKRAVVGLHEPFHYPDDTAELDALVSQPAPTAESRPDLSATELEALREEVEIRRVRAEEGKKSREKWMNEVFMVDAQKKGRKRSLMKMAKGWRWRAQTHDNKVGLTVILSKLLLVQVADHAIVPSTFQGNIVREIMKRRAEREGAIAEAAQSA